MLIAAIVLTWLGANAAVLGLFYLRFRFGRRSRAPRRALSL